MASNNPAVGRMEDGILLAGLSLNASFGGNHEIDKFH
jgi:hypothetical protein